MAIHIKGTCTRAFHYFATSEHPHVCIGLIAGEAIAKHIIGDNDVAKTILVDYRL